MNTPPDPDNPADPHYPDRELQLGTYLSSRAGVKMTVVLNKLPQMKSQFRNLESEIWNLKDEIWKQQSGIWNEIWKPGIQSQEYKTKNIEPGI